MNEPNGNGAPYNIVVTFPDSKKRVIYSCPDKEMVLTSLTTLALVHINENIRSRNGIRMIFEVTAAPVMEDEVIESVMDRHDGAFKAPAKGPKGEIE